jgi:hypothetical protein
MRKIIMAAVLALGFAAAPLAAMPAHASTSTLPTVTPAVSCTGQILENQLGLFLYNANPIVRLHNSGNETRYCLSAAGTTGDFWLVQDNTNLCLTYNATHNYIDEITCSTSVTASKWQEIQYGSHQQWVNQYTFNCLTGAVLNNPAKVANCSNSNSDLWHFA